MTSYKLELDTRKILNRFGPRFDRAQKYIDNEVLKDSDEYVPMRTGNLRNSGIRGTVLGSGMVVYNAPYAAKCYYGTHIKFSKNLHPKATAQWFEKAKAVNRQKWIDGAQKIVEGGTP